MSDVIYKDTKDFNAQELQDLFLSVKRIVLIAYDKAIGFYEKCGFKTGTDDTPMFLTSLWT
ncbi:MAG: hypothetical protein FWD71_13980 [Oscillospiraceae bacterium]|nr:hypothetical protein [Oscillospiraceae bacterium]